MELSSPIALTNGRITTPVPRSLARVRDADGSSGRLPVPRDRPTEALQAKMLTKDEARRIAVNIARLPDCLGRANATEQAWPPMVRRPAEACRIGNIRHAIAVSVSALGSSHS
jgi:hypothetical protein